MSDEMLKVLERLHVGTKDNDTLSHPYMDERLGEVRRKARMKKTPDDMKKDLEHGISELPSRLNVEWLDRLQQ